MRGWWLAGVDRCVEEGYASNGLVVEKGEKDTPVFSSGAAAFFFRLAIGFPPSGFPFIRGFIFAPPHTETVCVRLPQRSVTYVASGSPRPSFTVGASSLEI